MTKQITKYIKVFLASFIIFTIIFSFNNTEAKTKKISLNKKSIILKSGRTFTLKINDSTIITDNNSQTAVSGASVQTNAYPSGKTPTFKSTNEAIATVNAKGVIKGKKIGKCKIKVKYGNKNFTCKVKVKPALNATNVTTYQYCQFKLKLNGVYWKKCKYINTNPKLVAVGKYIPYITTNTKTGKCKIKIKYKGKTYVCKITVKPCSNKKPKYGSWFIEKYPAPRYNPNHVLEVQKSSYKYDHISTTFTWRNGKWDYGGYRYGFNSISKSEAKYISKVFKNGTCVPRRKGKYEGEKYPAEIWFYFGGPKIVD